MTDLKAIDHYLQQTQPKHLEQLKSLLRIPSVSADPAYRDSVSAAAQRVLDTLANAGLKTELIETDGPPLVYAESPPVTGTTTFSHRIHSIYGRPLHSSRPSVTAIFTPAARPTTRGKC